MEYVPLSAVSVCLSDCPFCRLFCGHVVALFQLCPSNFGFVLKEYAYLTETFEYIVNGAPVCKVCWMNGTRALHVDGLMKLYHWIKARQKSDSDEGNAFPLSENPYWCDVSSYFGCVAGSIVGTLTCCLFVWLLGQSMPCSVMVMQLILASAEDFKEAQNEVNSRREGTADRTGQDGNTSVCEVNWKAVSRTLRAEKKASLFTIGCTLLHRLTFLTGGYPGLYGGGL